MDTKWRHFLSPLFQPFTNEELHQTCSAIASHLVACYSASFWLLVDLFLNKNQDISSPSGKYVYLLLSVFKRERFRTMVRSVRVIPSRIITSFCQFSGWYIWFGNKLKDTYYLIFEILFLPYWWCLFICSKNHTRLERTSGGNSERQESGGVQVGAAGLSPVRLVSPSAHTKSLNNFCSLSEILLRNLQIQIQIQIQMVIDGGKIKPRSM